MKDALLTMGIGMGVVFLGLICLIAIIKLMSCFVGIFRKESRSARANSGRSTARAESSVPVSAAAGAAANARRSDVVLGGRSGEIAANGSGRRELVAAISAAVAEYAGIDANTIRIHSLHKVGDSPALDVAERRQLVAAISAAISEYAGIDTNGMRILSIRRIDDHATAPSADTAERRQLIAAISAAVATEMGADVSAIRIRSLRRVS